MLDLLPGVGVVLPGGGGTLRFGMAPAEVDALLSALPVHHYDRQCMSLTRADYAELRHAHDAWLTGILYHDAWSVVGTFGDVALSVSGGGPDRADLLTRIDVDAGVPWGEPAGTPVVWDGVDLFGNPAEDVLSVLPEPRCPAPESAAAVRVEPLGLWLSPPSPGADRWSRLSLLHTPTGWERCCAGTFACAAGGDGRVGLFL
ncbi:hypothetical protein AAHZ94_00530 [Streptomyces sp. HSW2009]|uniref:hypothetical protein n=1 Tax=Streptomyces sp. HSW2009 TaxID=3142890 RepID=UPI0032EF7F19